ncbi:MAG: DUF1963 domain-containing protein [Holosporales bacterium]|nr:DUF1963 domain-containing protein [Holosporales bacterium]
MLNSIERTLQDYIEITPFSTSTNYPWVSQVGGIPSILSTIIPPLSCEGIPMVFLAQINYSEIPQISYFPIKGVIQFYLSYRNLDDRHAQEDFKVIYIPELNKAELKPNTSVVDFLKYPLLRESRQFLFNKRKMPVPVCDYGFRDIYDEMFKDTVEMDKFEEIYFKKYARNCEHRIGGYPSILKERSEKNILLLQLSLGKNLMFGGDCFIIFLISEKDLQLQKFTDIECQIFWH